MRSPTAKDPIATRDHTAVVVRCFCDVIAWGFHLPGCFTPRSLVRVSHQRSNVSHRLSTLQVAVPQVSSAVAKRYRLLEPICGTAATCVERPKPIDPEPCPTIKELGHMITCRMTVAFRFRWRCFFRSKWRYSYTSRRPGSCQMRNPQWTHRARQFRQTGVMQIRDLTSLEIEAAAALWHEVGLTRP
jgi:hypothetical protein